MEIEKDLKKKLEGFKQVVERTIEIVEHGFPKGITTDEEALRWVFEE